MKRTVSFLGRAGPACLPDFMTVTTIMGLDVGEKRVGVAFASSSPAVATPHRTFPRLKGTAEKKVIELALERDVSTIVVGLPLGAGGERNPQCERIENFCRRLKKRLSVEIVFVDEYLTSEEAKERLGLRGSAEQKRRQSGDIDALAAAIILQAYLDEPDRFLASRDTSL